MKYSLPLLLGVAWVSILTLSGCSNDNLAQLPCAETTTCSQPVTNTCAGKNIASDKWTSLGLENESVSAIAVHPCNPGIIYAGTLFNFSDGIQGKLLKTTDCGTTWDTLAVGGSYRTIQLQPGNPDVVYAANGSILKSADGGQSWQQANEGIDLDAETGVQSLAIDPKNACNLYTGTSGFYGGGLYKSANGGASWQPVESNGLEENRLANGVTSLAINPNNPAEVYAGTALNGDVLHSFNGGITWLPTGLVDTRSIVDMLKVLDSNTVYAGIRFKELFFANISPFRDQWKQVNLPDTVDAALDIVRMAQFQSQTTVLATSNGLFIAENNEILKTFDRGLPTIYVNTIDRAVKSDILVIGLRQLNGKKAGIYIRKY